MRAATLIRYLPPSDATAEQHLQHSHPEEPYVCLRVSMYVDVYECVHVCV